LTNGAPSPEAKVFIDFVLSKEGQNILQKEGLVPVND
jgi:ABC-type Fe3+ transport system substrate-binding protein